MLKYVYREVHDKLRGADFKLDVGLYQLDQQVACQRYRQITIDAKTPISERLANAAATLKEAFAVRTLAPIAA